MFWIIVIALVVLVVLFKKGVFRKAGECRQCGKKIKGTEQIVFGSGDSRFYVCKECANKVHRQILKYAKENWSFAEFNDYIAWEEETKEQRAQFKPTNEYGYEDSLMVDTEHGLFTIGKSKLLKVNNEPGLVFRFEDLSDYDLNFKPEEVKEKLFRDKVRGIEYVMVELRRPAVLLEGHLNSGAEYSLKKKGLLSSKYEYALSKDFLGIIEAFTISLYIELAKQSGSASDENQDYDEIQKALALFMFDSMADVTEDNLKKQRNSLIKAFHPDGGEDNEAYAQKINAAYDLLSSLI